MSDTELLQDDPSLSGTTTAELTRQLYELLGPRIGALLVEPHIVLTLAGARGSASFDIKEPLPEDRLAIDQLGQALAQHHATVEITYDPFAHTKSIQILRARIWSMDGLAFISQRSQLLEQVSFAAMSGMAGVTSWRMKARQRLEELYDGQTILLPVFRSAPETINLILDRLCTGVPDICIFDHIIANINRHQIQPAFPNVLMGDLYGVGRLLDLSCLEEHESEPSLIRTAFMWGRILAAFYAHPWHQQIRTNPEFLAARALHAMS